MRMLTSRQTWTFWRRSARVTGCVAHSRMMDLCVAEGNDGNGATSLDRGQCPFFSGRLPYPLVGDIWDGRLFPLQLPRSPVAADRDAELRAAAVVSQTTITAQAVREEIADMNEQRIWHRLVPVRDTRVPARRGLRVYPLRHNMGRIPRWDRGPSDPPELRDPRVWYQGHEVCRAAARRSCPSRVA